MPDPEKAVLMRSVNEGIALFAAGLEPGDPDEADRWSFVCECGARDCVEWVELDLASYAEIRSRPEALVLAEGHSTAALDASAALRGAA
jgi:hypothetical protein